MHIRTTNSNAANIYQQRIRIAANEQLIAPFTCWQPANRVRCRCDQCENMRLLASWPHCVITADIQDVPGQIAKPRFILFQMFGNVGLKTKVQYRIRIYGRKYLVLILNPPFSKMIFDQITYLKITETLFRTTELMMNRTKTDQS